jgi:hypothetical protein
VSPTLSPESPGLTQVLTPQNSAPQGSTLIWVFPSPRAQLPRKAGPAASAVFSGPSAANAAAKAAALRIARAVCRIAPRGSRKTARVVVLDAIEADIGYPLQKASDAVAQIIIP